MESTQAKANFMKENKAIAPTPIRLSEELKQWLKHKAVDNFRSLNSEIASRLEASRKAEEASHEKQT